MTTRYSREEMEEILRRALRSDDESVSHEDLLAAAQEVGIDPDAVEKAAADLAAERAAGQREAVVLAEHRRGLWRAFWRFLAINGFMAAVDALAGPGWWFHWVTLVTGAFLVLRAIKAFHPSERDLQKAERKLQKREEERLWRKDRKAWHQLREKRKRETKEKFEAAVEEGVEALLHNISQHISGKQTAEPRVRVDGNVGTPHGGVSDRDVIDTDGEPVREPRRAGR